MIAAIAIAELVVIVALVVINRLEVDRSARTVLDLNEQFSDERRELLNRIQQPTWLAAPRAPRPNGDQDQEPPDEIGKVGTVAPPVDDEGEE